MADPVPASPDIDSNTFPSPGSMLPVASSTPLPEATPPSGTPAAAAQTSANAGNASPKQGAPNATPAQIQAAARPNHTSLFHGILNTLAGGGMRPEKDDQGNPVANADGTPHMVQATKKTLGMSILAGALAGMAAGFNTSSQPGIAHTSDADLNAFAKKAGTTQNNAKAGAQDQIDANRARMYTNVKQNMDMHLSAIALDKADRENQQGAVDRAEHIIDGVEQAGEAGLLDKEGKPVKDMILPGTFTNSQVMDMTKAGTFNGTTDQAVPA